MRLPLTLRPTPPLALWSALALGHLAAATVLWPTDLAIEFKLAASLLLLLSALAGFVRLRRNHPKALTLRADGNIEIEMPDGRLVEATMADGSTVLAWLVLLRLEFGGKYLTLPFTAETLSAEEFRSLRVWLRWRAAPDRQSRRYS